MVKRKRLGIRFDIAYATATGAVIYFMNIINALSNLPDEDKPEVFAFVSPDAPIEMIKKIDYPYLQIVPIKYLPVWARAINRIYRTIINGPKFNLLNAKTYRGKPLDGVLSLVIPSEDINTKRQLLWLADLQTYHLPENFSKKELRVHHNLKLKIIKGKHDIVLCSQWCIDDFNKIFPLHQSRMHKLTFTTAHPDFSDINIADLKKKYNVDRPYFIVSNQFWIHKNHIAVLKALNELKKEFPHLLCIITGNQKVSSDKSKNYVAGLMDYVTENQLANNVFFLGLIPREDQLSLMKNSIAIIQPSFFESWNTTVEDAKLLGKYIILSDLAVHKEQISENVHFFAPNDIKELVRAMKKLLQDGAPSLINYDYKKDVKNYAKSIIDMMN